MRYIDLHCDTLSAACDRGVSIEDGSLQAATEKLNKSNCAAQCFALFTEGDGAAHAFKNYLSYYEKCVAENKLKPVLCADDLRAFLSGGGTGSILTVENLGFLDDIARLGELREAGVRMASLVWNHENAYAYPNMPSCPPPANCLASASCPPPAQGGGAGVGVAPATLPKFLSERESRGLKPAGRAAVEELDRLKIIVDISHLSDGGAEEILTGRKIPAVASHSGAFGACGVSRNLTDELIKKIADCGGVIGIYYCKDFLGEGDTFARVFAHLQHIIRVGGEDVIALGSDFDGIPAPPGLESCERVPALLDYLYSRGMRAETLEKLCHKNFLRVFSEVCG